jgi:predicted nucleotidyltransferase
MTLASASAAKPVTRATAEKALALFLERVAQVNRNPYYLAKVVRVVLFGGILKPEVDRLSDVDVAIELARKEADPRRALVLSRQRAEELEDQGRRFRSILEREFCWYVEAYDFLKGRNRVLALADYSTERPFVLAVPHRFLIGGPEQVAVPEPAPNAPQKVARKRRRQSDCPF